MPKVTMQKHRQSIRLRTYDYASSGAYFVTICAAQKMHLFGEIVDAQMQLNEFGQIVHEEWQASAIIRKEIALDAFVIMPNHLHGILWIMTTDPSPVGATGGSPLHTLTTKPPKTPGPAKSSIGAMLAGFKSAVTKRINEARATPGVPVWQRNYYEHIVRNDTDLERIRTYIENNPAQWALDDLNTAVRA
jgi:putative transposase